MNKKKVIQITGVIVYFIGFGLLAYSIGWLGSAACGIILCGFFIRTL